MRAYYSDKIENFIQHDTSAILGQLTQKHSYSLEDLQKNAWLKQIDILKQHLYVFKNGHLFFEFSIPRMGKRVDNILVINDLIFILEFKIGDTSYQKYAIEQVVDYALDLKNFHEGSHKAKLIPILIATRAPAKENILERYQDNLYTPLFANETNLSEVISLCLAASAGGLIEPDNWANSIYKPTPTIIEAAQALYRGHNVQEISRSDSGAINLSRTTACINEIIENSKMYQKKSICFVTGVPGAGKTLAGLNIANERMKADLDEHAVFLSGNGPLVAVLREALVRDEVSNNKNLTKKQAAIKANAFIQNIHHFRDDNLISKKAPIEKVVVFDEAQRAWTKEQASSFMKRKKGKDDFDMSEPEFLIDVMNRHEDWCTIICLIGGGQEINTGEAGLQEWIDALKNHFGDWDIYYSSLIAENRSYISNDDIKRWLSENGNEKNDLHLSVSVRSFRSEKLSDFIHALLELNIEDSKKLYSEIREDYPLFITRDFNLAKQWLIGKSRGSERFGLLASSGAKRLRPYGIDVKNEIAVEYWFLNDKDDVRSSYFFEDIATEFDIQGLEIDWACMVWGENFYFDENRWNYQTFKGTKFQNINSATDRNYLKNSYRVLLTRARQGMVIYIPQGDIRDMTRDGKYYDGTYNYFKNIGIEEIK
ncbi:MAG: hypothetical protein QG567_852 [Campylobacterota bacterium]|nr:hypothetical protein [Campylobacterota bacterium]MDQ1338838.1 hypothetical protein [Campylobacterota bacterium]MDQ1339699.1 hypothetical protein [Campylobacterota bacterium]